MGLLFSLFLTLSVAASSLDRNIFMFGGALDGLAVEKQAIMVVLAGKNEQATEAMQSNPQRATVSGTDQNR